MPCHPEAAPWHLPRELACKVTDSFPSTGHCCSAVQGIVRTAIPWLYVFLPSAGFFFAPQVPGNALLREHGVLKPSSGFKRQTFPTEAATVNYRMYVPFALYKNISSRNRSVLQTQNACLSQMSFRLEMEETQEGNSNSFPRTKKCAKVLLWFTSWKEPKTQPWNKCRLPQADIKHMGLEFFVPRFPFFLENLFILLVLQVSVQVVTTIFAYIILHHLFQKSEMLVDSITAKNWEDFL